MGAHLHSLAFPVAQRSDAFRPSLSWPRTVCIPSRQIAVLDNSLPCLVAPFLVSALICNCETSERLAGVSLTFEVFWLQSVMACCSGQTSVLADCLPEGAL